MRYFFLPLLRKVDLGCDINLKLKLNFLVVAKRICGIALNDTSSEESMAAPKINKNFLPGRMAFVFNTNKKSRDIPTTIFRSEIEVSSHDRRHAESIVQSSRDGTNEIVLNKLIQILTYIRSGESGKLDKKRRKIDPEQSSKELSRAKMPEAEGEDRSSHKLKKRNREEKDRKRNETEVIRDDRDRRRVDRDEKPRDDRYRDEKYSDDRRESSRRTDRERDSTRRDQRDRDRRGRDKHEERDMKFIKPDPKPGKAVSDADSDDIFADIGADYKPDLKRPKKTAQPVSKDGKTFQKSETDIENELPKAPEKPKKTINFGTTDEVIAAANKLAEAKRRGLTLEQLEKEGSKAIPDGATGFGRLAVDEDYDDDDRFEDAEDIRRLERKRGKLMNHKSYANSQWQQVSGMLDKKKGKNYPIK